MAEEVGIHGCGELIEASATKTVEKRSNFLTFYLRLIRYSFHEHWPECSTSLVRRFPALWRPISAKRAAKTIQNDHCLYLSDRQIVQYPQ
jgi:hypothetical protein